MLFLVQDQMAVINPKDLPRWTVHAVEQDEQVLPAVGRCQGRKQRKPDVLPSSQQLKKLSPRDKTIGASLKDLCQLDKQRIAKLISELAHATELKDLAAKNLQEERATFEAQLSDAQSRLQTLLKSREELDDEYKQSLDLLQRYRNQLLAQEGALAELRYQYASQSSTIPSSFHTTPFSQPAQPSSIRQQHSDHSMSQASFQPLVPEPDWAIPPGVTPSIGRATSFSSQQPQVTHQERFPANGVSFARTDHEMVTRGAHAPPFETSQLLSSVSRPGPVHSVHPTVPPPLDPRQTHHGQNTASYPSNHLSSAPPGNEHLPSSSKSAIIPPALEPRHAYHGQIPAIYPSSHLSSALTGNGHLPALSQPVVTLPFGPRMDGGLDVRPSIPANGIHRDKNRPPAHTTPSSHMFTVNSQATIAAGLPAATSSTAMRGEKPPTQPMAFAQATGHSAQERHFAKHAQVSGHDYLGQNPAIALQPGTNPQIVNTNVVGTHSARFQVPPTRPVAVHSSHGRHSDAEMTVHFGADGCVRAGPEYQVEQHHGNSDLARSETQHIASSSGSAKQPVPVQPEAAPIDRPRRSCDELATSETESASVISTSSSHSHCSSHQTHHLIEPSHERSPAEHTTALQNHQDHAAERTRQQPRSSSQRERHKPVTLAQCNEQRESTDEATFLGWPHRGSVGSLQADRQPLARSSPQPRPLITQSRVVDTLDEDTLLASIILNDCPGQRESIQINRLIPNTAVNREEENAESHSDDLLSEDSRNEPTHEELIEAVSQLEEPERTPRKCASSSRSLPLPRHPRRHRGQVTRMLRSNQKGHEEENLLDELFFHHRH